MKYWKGKTGTNKENQYGTMDNNGYVPDSITINKYQYEQYINSLSIIPTIDKKIEYGKMKNIDEQIQFIAKELKLIEEK